MIAHVSIGARDIARARRFYDAALKPLGYTCLHSAEGSLGYGAKNAGLLDHRHWASGAGGRPVRPAHLLRRAGPRVGRCLPQGGAEERRQRQRQAGAAPDYGPNYYAAFAVDPDGYRIEAWCGNKS